MENHNACKYFIGESTTEEQCINFDQSISKLLNINDIDKRFKIRQKFMIKIIDLRDIVVKIVDKYDVTDKYKIKADMNETVNQFKSMFLNKNEVRDKNSIDNCVNILHNSIYLTNECVKKYIINTIIELTENIDNDENIQKKVIIICEREFNSFNSFVKNYNSALGLIVSLKKRQTK